MKEIILINISGPDKQGVTSSVTAILAKHNVNILDVGQAVIHNTLALGILAEFSGSDSWPALKEVLFRINDMGLQSRFSPVSPESYQEWVSDKGKDRHIVTLLSRKITAEHIARVSSIIAEFELNIDNISRLSGRIGLNDSREREKACVELSVRGDSDNVTELKAKFLEVSAELELDIAVQKDDMYRRTRRLVCFDMDSTLIEAEVIDELAKEAGVGEQVSEITELAMQGEIDFDESFRRRVALLKGLDESVLASIADRLKLTEGAEQLLKTLNTLGYKTAILSGGFTYFARHLQKKLNIDYVHANELDIQDGKVTGDVVGTIVNGERKAELLKEIAEREGIVLDQVIAVGDGANDLPMLSVAGLGVAFRAKPLVRKTAKHAISNLGLDAILYLIGMRDRDESHL
ncbi:phosphoserine phosphatase SerB [Litoribrevibacter albus]|uniref:Phosphoserine phosphatase n=1 Tax=Litoribrevibacter albus TaxID=1473156 RepID=A0AA37S9F3_9GAMM|nr:phosphoserine phosphatase SerB [Litoribrevibacter albus]GLQ30616.1 phosphoserine phosphatase SerB [Litoribrevibacter albus]